MARIDLKDGIAYRAVAKVLHYGEEVAHVIMADSDRGIIECYKTNKHGELVHINGGLCKTELNGVVEIIFNSFWRQQANGDYTYTYAGKKTTVANPLKHKLKFYDNANNS